MKTVIFLGAGASKTEGAPLQNELLWRYFQNRQDNNYRQGQEERETRTFFHKFFGIDVYNETSFPTFEEVLGVIDIAERRNESFKNFDLENNAANSNRLRMLRVHLIQLLAEVIKENLLDRNGVHDTLIRNIPNHQLKNNIVFISANYDILIDNAITRQVNINGAAPINYGVNFTNPTRENDWQEASSQSIDLFKIHGSLNWLYCSVCNTLTLTPGKKGVTGLNKATEESLCTECESLLSPIIIPPTYFKEMSNAFISQVWFQIEKKLRSADHIIFCGYSFPDADIHIKYLLKRAQVNTNDWIGSKNFTVINDHEDKTDEAREIEESRYKRFLGKHVNYTQFSFEDFAENPQEVFQ